jgi:hypothetical protein
MYNKTLIYYFYMQCVKNLRKWYPVKNQSSSYQESYIYYCFPNTIMLIYLHPSVWCSPIHHPVWKTIYCLWNIHLYFLSKIAKLFTQFTYRNKGFTLQIFFIVHQKSSTVKSLIFVRRLNIPWFKTIKKLPNSNPPPNVIL